MSADKQPQDAFDSLDIFDKIQLKVEEAIENGEPFNIKALYELYNTSSESKYTPLTYKYLINDQILDDDYKMIMNCAGSLSENDTKFINNIHTKKYKLSEAQLKWLNGIIGRCKRNMRYFQAIKSSLLN